MQSQWFKVVAIFTLLIMVPEVKASRKQNEKRFSLGKPHGFSTPLSLKIKSLGAKTKNDQACSQGPTLEIKGEQRVRPIANSRISLPGSSNEALFCTDPLRAVCGNSSALEFESSEREKESMIENIKRRVVSNTNNTSAYVTELQNQLREILPEVEKAFTEAKTHFISAVESNPIFSQAAKDQVAFLISQTQLVVFPQNTPEELMRFASTCGPELTTPNAFASPTENQIGICPGMIMTAMAFGKNIDTFLMHTIGHELGHVAEDVLSGSRVERALVACIVNSSSGMKEETNGTESELGADFWGSEVLALHLNSLGLERGSVLERIQIAQKFLCTANDTPSPTHPPRKLRIEGALGSNEKLRRIFGCSSGESCRLGGLI